MRQKRGEESVGDTGKKTEGEKKRGDRGQEMKLERNGGKGREGLTGTEQMNSS